MSEQEPAAPSARCPSCAFALARVDPEGYVRSINRPGRAAWGWQAGSQVPPRLRPLFQETRGGGLAVLQQNGLSVLGFPLEPGRGWLLFGCAPHESPEAFRPVSLFEKEPAAQQPGADLEARQFFETTMRHELRAPLGAIADFADLLAQELETFRQQSGTLLPEPIPEVAEAIRDRSRKLLKLVDRLFDTLHF